MQVTVTVNDLNVRVGAPNLNAPNNGLLLAGTVIDVDDKLYSGDLYEGISTWLRDAANNYYWSGGVNVFQQWMIDLNIPQIWKYATGKGVGIAVVDTGIDIQNTDLPFDKSNYYIFDETVSLQDTYGHGTHCSGLIGARNKNEKMVGVAPDCNLFVCKIAEDGDLPEALTTRYADAINWCADQPDINVISISWASFIDDKEIISIIQDAITNANQKNKVVVCAIGDASQFNDPGPLYPASLDKTIAIGSIPVENVLYPYINNSLTTIIEGVEISSYALNGQLIIMDGTSQSNAIVAGIVALLIEKQKLAYSADGIKQLLSDISTTQNFNGILMPVIDGNLLLKYFQS